MIVTLIKKENISTLTLPEKVSGQYWLKDANELGISQDLIGIEGVNGKWILKSNKSATVIDLDKAKLRNTILHSNSFYNLEIVNYDQKAFVFTEPITENRQKYKKLIVKSEAELIIGRNSESDIVFANRFVSSNHARLTFYKGQWNIVDMDSTNGTFVNGSRVYNKALVPGDIVYIMGLKIVIGNCFIAFNNPDEQVTCKSKALLPFIKQTLDPVSDDEEEYELTTQEYFYRSPRFKRDIEKAVIKVDSPPPNAVGDEMPLMFVLGPSMTMGMASMTTGIFAVNNAMATGNMKSALPSIVMSFSMLLGTVLWPILSKRYEKKKKMKRKL